MSMEYHEEHYETYRQITEFVDKVVELLRSLASEPKNPVEQECLYLLVNRLRRKLMAAIDEEEARELAQDEAREGAFLEHLRRRLKKE